jgi:molecular chaperone DnaJ
MAVKDYYLVLGVPREESDSGIRAVFRSLVNQYHPDRAGPQSASILRDIAEAYGVLSDPERRRRYNQQLRRREVPPQEPPGPLRSGAAFEAEPLMPEPMFVPRDFEPVGNSVEQLMDRLRGNFTHLGVPKGDRLESLDVEVHLSPSAAARGAVLPIGLPVFRSCPVCGGAGHDWLFPCLSCDEQGIVEEERQVRVRIPAGVDDGAIFEMPLQGLAIENLYLRLHVRIDRAW